jgi:hypothetical protein
VVLLEWLAGKLLEQSFDFGLIHFHLMKLMLLFRHFLIKKRVETKTSSMNLWNSIQSS